MQKQYIVPTPPLPPPFMKGGGMKFFRNGYNGELGNFHWKLGGSQEWGGGVGFIMGEGGVGREDGKILKSLDIVDGGVLTPLFYEDPPLYGLFPIFQMFTPPVICSQQLPFLH